MKKMGKNIIMRLKTIMTPGQKTIKLAKFLSYVLGYRPDEFGLVPDARGYVKIKDLLKALGEEDGWRHIRRSAIDELCMTLAQQVVELNDNMIRAVQRDRLLPRRSAQNPPKLLYTCIRQKAHRHALQKGIFPMGSDCVILSPDPEMALRMGRRIDQQPVQLTVHVQTALKQGVVLDQSGDLYIADFIPVGCFTAPPLPKEKIDPKARETNKEKPVETMPGSFFMDLTRDGLSKKSYSKERKHAKQPWKKDRKKQRKQKEKLRRP